MIWYLAERATYAGLLLAYIILLVLAVRHRIRRGRSQRLLAWALGVARLKLQAALRRSRTRGLPYLPYPLVYEDLAEAARSDEQVVELLHYVWLLDHLAPLDRMIVQGRQAGYTSRELARELQHIGYPHMTANNVDQRFYRALKTLRGRIGAEDVEGRP